jgi:hypothetical protein
MAKQRSRPSLDVQATPVSTFTAAVAPAVELYDQQSVNLALQFADAFKDLSVSAANLAGTLKKESNEKELQRGMDLVNQSRKSYKQLMDSGEIKPTENPWMAIGAQQASGTMEGMKARAHFNQIYEQRSQQDQAFFDNQTSFDALAAQYADNVNKTIGNTPYMARSFYEAFNPHIASMGMKHEAKVTEARNQKVLVGIGAEFSKAVQDSRSQDPIIKNNALASLQETTDEFIRMGYSPKQVNEAIIDNAINVMATTDDVDAAERIFAQLRSGTGLLKDTEYAKGVLLANRAKIESNKQRLTTEESKKFYDWSQRTVAEAVAGKITQEEALERFDKFVESEITISGPESESKRAWLLNSIGQGKQRAEQERIKQNENTIYKTINDSFQVPTEYLQNEDAYRGKLEDRLENMFVEFGISEEDKLKFRNLFAKEWENNSEKRMMFRVQAMTEELWNGSIGADGNRTPGIMQVAQDEIGTFFAPKPGEAPTVPNFASYKNQIDEVRTQMGIQPNTEKANALYKADYDRLSKVIDAYETQAKEKFNGSLQPNVNDSLDVREAKTQTRSSLRFLRMKMGTAFNDNREAIRAVHAYNAAMNPASAERGENTDAFEDNLRAYRLAVLNGVDLDQVVVNPQSPNGKRMLTELKWAVSQLGNGVQPTDIQRDLAMGRVFGTELDTNFYERANPLGWLQFGAGSGVDSDSFNAGMMAFRQENGVTEPDAAMYSASQFWNKYLDAARGEAMGDGEKAIKIANEKVLQDNLIVRGSLIPKRKLNVDADFIEAYLRVKYPKNPRATFVVVQNLSDGTAMLAAREDGQALDYGLIPSTSLNVSSANPETIQFFKEVRDMKDRVSKQKIERERAIRRPLY